MSELSLFTDFFTHTTGPAYVTGPDAIINDAQLRNYEAFDALSRMKMELQGGNQIKDTILLDLSGRADSYNPGDTASVQNTQHQTTITQDWRFVRSYVTYTEAEIMLNEGSSDSERYHQYKNLRDAKYQEMYTDLITQIERFLVQKVANSKTSDPDSIFNFVTSDGLAASGSTVMGVNPSTKTAWQNQTASYTSATPYDTDNGIIAGFDTISQLVRFKSPNRQQKHFTESSFNNLMIMTNREGRRDYMKALRANNDVTRTGPQDPSYGSPVFLGVPVVACEGFDDQSIWSGGSPGFMFINGNYLKLFCHSKKWFQVGNPKDHADKPDTKVVWCDNYLNLFCRSRARHGYLSAS